MEIKIPEVGESVREALLAKWFKQDGAMVNKDEPLCEIETDKITLDLNADAAGLLSIKVAEGTTVPVGTVIGLLSEQAVAVGVVPATAATAVSGATQEADFTAVAASPSVRRQMREKGIDPAMVTGTGKGGRITADDIAAGAVEQSPRQTGITAIQQSSVKPPESLTPAGSAMPLSVRSEETPEYSAAREERRPMSPLRKRIAERLLAARQQTAMLTTFNEADMSQIMALRARHRDHFMQRHGVKLGFMPFFVKACCEALREFPAVNASISGDDLVYHHFYDIGIAIGGAKGLVVPIMRNADRLHLHEIDQAINGFVEKIKANQLAIADLEGGTFTISNGGVYGSMLSTPILNPPQSAVLGMHAIQNRPVARDGQVVIRPMMYLALSYDHRIIDGREAVGFLGKIKEYVENPEELLLEG